jgi:hypothetical protein
MSNPTVNISTAINQQDLQNSLENEKEMKTLASVDSFTTQKLVFKPIEPIQEQPSLLRFFSTPKFISRQFQQETPLQIEVDMDEPLSLEEEKDLWITARLEHTRNLECRDEKSSWFNELSIGFLKAKESVIGTASDQNRLDVDWDFWGRVINDYEKVVGQHPRQFQKNMQLGLPEPIRGMMWQLMSNSKSEVLEGVGI